MTKRTRSACPYGHLIGGSGGSGVPMARRTERSVAADLCDRAGCFCLPARFPRPCRQLFGLCHGERGSHGRTGGNGSRDFRDVHKYRQYASVHLLAVVRHRRVLYLLGFGNISEWRLVSLREGHLGPVNSAKTRVRWAQAPCHGLSGLARA